jgi:mucosa-associated lymphoid tissue lymphoma translocation protein 1
MLAESFQALDFRVVSLLNLTKSEMENAVLHFIDLLGKNVYAVFYFCGHGFEEHGMSYLIPSDGPTGSTAKECVCAQEILANIQKKEPPVIFMILDICRDK